MDGSENVMIIVSDDKILLCSKEKASALYMFYTH